MAGSIVGGMVGQGALGGVAKSLGGGANTAAAMGAMGAGAAGLSGLGKTGIKPPISSQELGMAGTNNRISSDSTPTAFGNNNLGTSDPRTIEQTPMSFGEKFKTGMKGGLYGGLGGLGAGSLAAAGHALHADRLVRPMVHDIQGAGLNKAFEAGQISVANHSLRDIDRSMVAMEPQNINLSTTAAVMPGEIPNGIRMTAPGDALNNMENVDRGHQIFDSPQNQQEFLNIQRHNVTGFENLKPEMQNQVDTRLMGQLNQHPASAGKIVDYARGEQGKTFESL